ncbi:CDP-glycerol glycerophosphotransferase family protein [Peribacillus frigoritolerans]|uniref:CDP-glycerol glycerophosphotransferase family protein n=1 Tax=Peribacillus frigoritolerans TaxID=450367 RepID=UPI000FD86B61|nr:CDP-glycerol glycerophosphotransferase family protein [Peribacillus frigoritolerans]AZV62120.1 CDP-glycerol--glycerophosphate glycerophosphotransferase [Peribacillus frigoritolerans]
MIKKLLGKGKAKKAPKIKLKQVLTIAQEENMLLIKGEFSIEHYCAKELWLYSRENEDQKIKIAESVSSSKFDFKVDMKDLMRKLADDEPTVYDCYIKVAVPIEKLSKKTILNIEHKAEYVEENEQVHIEFPIRLGRFQETYTNNLSIYTYEDKQSIFSITNKGNISLYINKTPKIQIKSQIEKIKNNSKTMHVNGQIFTKHSAIIKGEGLVRGRQSGKEYQANLSFIHNKEMNIKKFGLNRYIYDLKLDLEQLVSVDLEDDVYDIYMKLHLHDQEEPKMVRVGRPTTRTKLFTKKTDVSSNDGVAIINPYYTFKASNLSLEVFNFSTESYRYLKKMMGWRRFLSLFKKKKDVWLIGERTYKAQDTGYHFFKYMRENHPEKEVYYVIEENSVEAKNVEPFGNILYFKSKDHIKKTMESTRIISSHHPDYLYPLRTSEFKNRVKGVKVFLQHGVMGTKNMVANYGKNAASGFSTDVFLVSSDFEKDMIVTDFGYNEKEVFTTGLSRFDSLFKDDVLTKRQLLIIPTWRDWITSDEIFLESEYFERYQNLVNHPALHELSKNNGFEIIFCLHPNMQKFTSYFKDAPVRVISQGEVDVQRLIKESAIMITDYSSVAFDFSFLHKPVIYYQFDRDRFIGKRPSHLDLDNDLPGEIVDELDGLLGVLAEYANTDFVMKKKYIDKANRFIKYRDVHSNSRIFEVIQHAEKDQNSLIKLYNHPISKLIMNRFRKSEQYFPVMKKVYKIMSRIIPVDRNLILFESGIGKQFSDSPKYIYEELVKRDNKYKKVWVYNGNLPIKGKNTKLIKRLSPEYYYYLAKAGYWINNQNFPTYLSKRKETTYIQTWHGTPLKKMLFDIDNIQGRDEGYLNRVHGATRTWDYLISPSPYASKAFRSAFKYEGEILETGYPRNDLFYKEDASMVADSVMEKLKIPKGKKVILYAPTFRDNQTSKNNKFIFELKFDLERMKEELGDEYILLLRMHVVISNNLSIPSEFEDFVINVSNYSDIQELYLISDILITDYSSVMFDFANTARPILYYTYDLEDYRDNIRGFYMDFEKEAPGPFLKTTEEIIDTITNMDEINMQYKERYGLFREKYCGIEDGKATQRIVDKFFND